MAKLLGRDPRRLVGLGMRPEAHADALRPIGHVCEVRLQPIELDEHSRRVEVGDPCPDSRDSRGTRTGRGHAVSPQLPDPVALIR